MPTWLITGCSSGLGRALAEAVTGTGHNAVVTVRDVANVADLADAKDVLGSDGNVCPAPPHPVLGTPCSLITARRAALAPAEALLAVELELAEAGRLGGLAVAGTANKPVAGRDHA